MSTVSSDQLHDIVAPGNSAGISETGERDTQAASERITFLGASFDLAERDQVLHALRERTHEHPFRYVVTPNVDTVVRLLPQDHLRPVFEQAWMSWCDSRIVQLLAKTLGIAIPHNAGSDVVDDLFR